MYSRVPPSASPSPPPPSAVAPASSSSAALSALSSVSTTSLSAVVAMAAANRRIKKKEDEIESRAKEKRQAMMVTVPPRQKYDRRIHPSDLIPSSPLPESPSLDLYASLNVPASSPSNAALLIQHHVIDLVDSGVDDAAPSRFRYNASAEDKDGGDNTLSSSSALSPSSRPRPLHLSPPSTTPRRTSHAYIPVSVSTLSMSSSLLSPPPPPSSSPSLNSTSVVTVEMINMVSAPPSPSASASTTSTSSATASSASAEDGILASQRHLDRSYHRHRTRGGDGEDDAEGDGELEGESGNDDDELDSDAERVDSPLRAANGPFVFDVSTSSIVDHTHPAPSRTLPLGSRFVAPVHKSKSRPTTATAAAKGDSPRSSQSQFNVKPDRDGSHHALLMRLRSAAADPMALVKNQAASLERARTVKGQSSSDKHHADGEHAHNGDEAHDDASSDDFCPANRLRPTSHALTLWRFFLMLVSMYNGVSVPYRMAFWSMSVPLASSDVFVWLLILLDTIGDICYALDILRALHTGFLDSGVVIYDSRAIRKAYWKSGWLAFDIACCVPFDFVQVSSMTLLPFVRILKMLRLVQVLHYYNGVEESTSVSLTFRVGKLLFFTGMLSHFAACIKYHVMLQSAEASVDLATRSEFGRYLQAMYWSSAAMTGRDDSNAPDSLADAGFTITMMFLGILWLAYLIAGLEMFAHDSHESARAKFNKQAWLTKQFMHQYKMSTEMKAKVEAYHSYLWSSSLRHDEQAFLATLSTSLRADVALALHPLIVSSVLFAGCDTGFLSYVVSHLSTLVTVPGEIVVEAGMVGTELFFIREGSVDVCIGSTAASSSTLSSPAGARDQMATIATLRAGDYFGEYALFPAPHSASCPPSPSSSSSPPSSGPHLRSSTVRSATYSTLVVVAFSDLELAMRLFPSSGAFVRSAVEVHRSKTMRQERNFRAEVELAYEKLKYEGREAEHHSPFTTLVEKEKTFVGRRTLMTSKLMKLIRLDSSEPSSLSSAPIATWTLCPRSTGYFVWSYLVLTILCWNAFTLPIRIGFYPDSAHAAVLSIDYIGDAILWLDIALNFRLRFTSGGLEVTDLRRIKSRYVNHGWFIWHVISSIPLDVIMLYTRVMQPLLRLNRCVRLLHMHVETLVRIKSAQRSEVLSLAYLISNFLMLSHWAASIYFSFTRFEGFAADLTYGPMAGTPNYDDWRPASIFANSSVVYQYLQSQYYAMALLAGIGRHLYPPSSVDVILSLGVMLTGVFVVSYLIGKVGHLIFQLNASAARFKNETQTTNQLLEYRKVPPVMKHRVGVYMKHQWFARRGIDPNLALDHLPRRLRSEIMLAICGDMMRTVPRFRNLEPKCIEALVTELTFLELPAGEFVARQGHVGNHMYFIAEGIVEILFDVQTRGAGGRNAEDEEKEREEEEARQGGSVHVSSDEQPSSASFSSHSSPSPTSPLIDDYHQLKLIGAGSFFGEGALFSGLRAASIRSRTPARLLALSAESFAKVMERDPVFGASMKVLATQRRTRVEEQQLQEAKVAADAAAAEAQEAKALVQDKQITKVNTITTKNNGESRADIKHLSKKKSVRSPRAAAIDTNLIASPSSSPSPDDSPLPHPLLTPSTGAGVPLRSAMRNPLSSPSAKNIARVVGGAKDDDVVAIARPKKGVAKGASKKKIATTATTAAKVTREPPSMMMLDDHVLTNSTPSPPASSPQSNHLRLPINVSSPTPSAPVTVPSPRWSPFSSSNGGNRSIADLSLLDSSDTAGSNMSFINPNDVASVVAAALAPSSSTSSSLIVSTSSSSSSTVVKSSAASSSASLPPSSYASSSLLPPPHRDHRMSTTSNDIEQFIQANKHSHSQRSIVIP